MAYDPLLAVLGLAALATPTVPTTFLPTGVRGGVAIEPGALPSSPTYGTLAIDSGDFFQLKWWNGTVWQTAGGGSPSSGNVNYIQMADGSGGFQSDGAFQYSSGTLTINGVGYQFPASDGTSGYVLSTDGAGVLSWVVNGSTPAAGGDTEIQYNSFGTFAANSGFYYNGSLYVTTGGVNADNFNSSGTNPLVFGSPTNADIHMSGGGTLRVVDAGYAVTLFSLDASGNLMVPGTTTLNTVAYTWPGADGTSGYVLSTDGAGTLSWIAAGGTPAGANTEIQFNNSGAFGASSNFTWTNDSGLVVIGSTNNIVVAGTRSITGTFYGFRSAVTNTGGLTAAQQLNGYYSFTTYSPTSPSGAGSSVSGAHLTGDISSSNALNVLNATSYGLNSTAQYNNSATAGGGVTAIIGVQANTNFLTSNNIGTATATEVSGFKTGGVYSNGGSGASTITNYYGLNLASVTLTGGMTITNRYGIYQADSAAINYFAGVIRLAGSTSGSATIKVAATAGTPADLTLPTTSGSSGNVLSTDGAGVLSWIAAGGGGTPAGSNTQIQYNNAGAFGASNKLTWDGNTVAIISTTRATDFTVNVPNSSTSAFGVLSTVSAASGILNPANIWSLYGQATLSGVVTTSGTLTGTYIGTQDSHTSGTLTTVFGIDNDVSSNGTGNVTTVYGIRSVAALTQTKTAGVLYGAYISATNALATTGTMYGLYVHTNVTSGTVSTHYGVYQSNASALNYFFGNTSVGVAPSASTFLNLGVGTTAISSMRIPLGGVARTSPSAGDIWGETTYIRVQLNGASNYFVIAPSLFGGTDQVALTSSTNSPALLSDSTFRAVTTDGMRRVILTGTSNGSSITSYLSSYITNAATGGTINAVEGKVTIGNSSAGSSVGLYGLVTGSGLTSTNTLGQTAVLGYVNLSYGGTNPNPDIIAVIARVRIEATVAGHTQASVKGLQVDVTASSPGGASTLTNLYGVYISTPSSSYTITNRYAIYQQDPASQNYFAGDVKIQTAGKGLFIKEGTNAKMGIATLVAGTVVVSTTAVSASSRIFLSTNASGGTPGFLIVSTRSAGTSFTILSSDAGDTSQVAWMIVDPS